jgi:integrase
MAIFDAALEPSTHSTYATHRRQYTTFCHQFHLQPFPATKATLQLYAAHWVATGHAHTTLPAIFSAIKDAHRRHGWAWLSTRDQEWMAAYMRGIRKSYPHRPRRKQPMTMSILHQLAAIANFANVHEVQYIAMAFLAHDGLLRACELLNLVLSDVRWFDDCVRLRLRNSKANKLSGQPEYVFIYPNQWDLCGYSALAAYWRRMQFNTASNHHSPLFPSSHPATPIPKQAWVDYIRHQLARIGHDPMQFSGHSFRSGGATDLWLSGTRPRVIQKFGRWLSDAFWLYIRDNPTINAQEVASAFSRLADIAL